MPTIKTLISEVREMATLFVTIAISTTAPLTASSMRTDHRKQYKPYPRDGRGTFGAWPCAGHDVALVDSDGVRCGFRSIYGHRRSIRRTR